MGDDFIPRISVPDAEDASTVAVALTEYVHAVAHRGMMSGDLRHMITEVQRSSALLSAIIDEAESHVVQEFMSDLSDDDFSEMVENFKNDMGENPDV